MASLLSTSPTNIKDAFVAAVNSGNHEKIGAIVMNVVYADLKTTAAERRANVEASGTVTISQLADLL